MLGTYKMRNTLKNCMQVICHILCATCMMGGAGKKNGFSSLVFKHPPQTMSSPLSNSPPAFFGRHWKSPPEPQRAPSPSWSTKTERLEGSKSHPPCLTINRDSSWLDSPHVQEQKRRKSPLSPPPGLLLAPHLAQGTWTPGCSPCHRNTGYMGDIPAACWIKPWPDGTGSWLKPVSEFS